MVHHLLHMFTGCFQKIARDGYEWDLLNQHLNYAPLFSRAPTYRCCACYARPHSTMMDHLDRRLGFGRQTSDVALSVGDMTD